MCSMLEFKMLSWAIHICHKFRKIFNIGGAQTTASKASRPSACARRSRGPGGWPPGRGCGCEGAGPPCLRKFGILQAKYA